MEDIWYKDRVRSFTKPDLLWKRIQLDAEKLYTRLYTMIENGTSSFMFPLAESFAHDFGVRGYPFAAKFKVMYVIAPPDGSPCLVRYRVYFRMARISRARLSSASASAVRLVNR